MDNKILTEKVSFFKKAAKKELKGNWLIAAVAILIYLLILGAMKVLVNTLPMVNLAKLIAGIYYVLMFGPAVVGIVMFYMNLVRNKNHSIKNCFEGFEAFKRNFVLGFLMRLFTVLWALLLVVPGIIAYYRYSMAPMIAIERPDLTPLECISESKRIMKGNKKKKLFLDISFLGWALLASVPRMLFPVVVEIFQIKMNLILCSILINVVEFPVLFVLAYMRTTDIVFYEELIKPIFYIKNNNKSNENSNGEEYSYQRYSPEDVNTEAECNNEAEKAVNEIENEADNIIADENPVSDEIAIVENEIIVNQEVSDESVAEETETKTIEESETEKSEENDASENKEE